MKQRNVIILILLLFLGAFAYFLFVRPHQTPEPGGQCTLEAKVCPDGSSVGRVPPACEFSPCPEVKPAPHPDWKEIYVPGLAVFRAPQTFPGKYVTAPDWPPKLSLSNDIFRCTEAGALDKPAGRTEERTVNGRTYCVTERREGAAGSVYSLYAYAFPTEKGQAILTFSLRRVQCANFSEERQACEEEQGALDVDGLVDALAETLEIAPSAYKDLIRVTTPLPGSDVTATLSLRGEARGSWYFEGSFPLAVVDREGDTIAQGSATAQGDWMTEDYVPFTATLSLPVFRQRTEARVILTKSNPSGRPEHEDSFEYRIMLH
jgi:hypothetical protein